MTLEQPVLIISKDQVQALRERLADPAQLGAGITEVRRMLRIKSKLLMDSCTAC